MTVDFDCIYGRVYSYQVIVAVAAIDTVFDSIWTV